MHFSEPVHPSLESFLSRKTQVLPASLKMRNRTKDQKQNLPSEKVTKNVWNDKVPCGCKTIKMDFPHLTNQRIWTSQKVWKQKLKEKQWKILRFIHCTCNHSQKANQERAEREVTHHKKSDLARSFKDQLARGQTQFARRRLYRRSICLSERSYVGLQFWANGKRTFHGARWRGLLSSKKSSRKWWSPSPVAEEMWRRKPQ